MSGSGPPPRSPDSSTRARRWGWSVWAFGVAVLGLCATLGIQRIRTFDYWWHLRTGELIVATGSVPKVDVYSYTAEGARWIDIHWLFQVGLHGVESLGGHDAVVIAKAVLIALLAAIVGTIGWRRERPVVTAAGLALMLLIAGDRFMPRPELPSFVLLAAVLALLERHDRRPDNWVYAIVPLQLLWANVHGLFALGIVVCAIYGVAEVLRPLLTPGAPLRRDRIARLAVVALGSAAVSLLNPNGVDGALYPIEQLGMIGPPEDRGYFGSLISELVPPLGGKGSNVVAMSLVGALAALSFGAMLLNWSQLPGAHPLLWVAFGYLGLGARRNLALLGIVFAPVFVRNCNEFLDRHPLNERVQRAAIGIVLVGLVALCVSVGSGKYFAWTGSTREPGLGVSRMFYPDAAVEWIAREQPEGPIFHHMADGGYLIWRLYPDYRVMSDGRLEVYGPERFQKLLAGRPDAFRAADAEYHFRVVLIHYTLISSKPMLRWLHLNSNWRLVFLDESAAVYVRVPVEGELPWPELDVDSPNLFAERPTEDESMEVFLGSARTNWHVAMGRYDQALAEWERIRDRHSSPRSADLVQAMLLSNTGKPAAGEAILRRLLEDSPEDASLLTQIGDLRFEMGDLEKAEEFYDRALEVDPRLAYALLRRGSVAQARGDVERARALFGQALTLSTPPDAVWLEARQRLVQLPPLP